MRHYNQHDKIRLVGVVTIAMLVGLLAGGRRAHAQASDDPSARANDSSVAEGSAPPGVELLSIDAPGAPAASADAITADGTDDSAVPPVSANSDVGYAPSGSAMGSEDASGSDPKNAAVLEIPQVVNLQSGGTANATADETPANLDDDDNTAQSSQDEEDTAGDHDLVAIGSQVGTLEDYQNQANEAPLPSAIFSAPIVTVTRLPRSPLFNPLPRTPSGVPMLASPIILPPTSSGPFPSTSPMLMGPRFGTFGSFPPRIGSFPRVSSFPRAGLMGAHR